VGGAHRGRVALGCGHGADLGDAVSCVAGAEWKAPGRLERWDFCVSSLKLLPSPTMSSNILKFMPFAKLLPGESREPRDGNGPGMGKGASPLFREELFLPSTFLCFGSLLNHLSSLPCLVLHGGCHGGYHVTPSTGFGGYP
jgi:hypothetical protein